ncbi:hypothetical protein BOX15_Mlig031978g1 [Macrostomum lignano]|uniref:Uncharacterized protein n=2 Tax=Macrostomum lignano TaxID=282301 RepID=A0A267F234_9PLAT|nr:hypothetical protein BOX15_Mlig031978g3 [Macrostomum lignano]PAA67092.1 hypothetical protein BOX15_Mlig031978g2 [Macrostomum lignano]PAA69972.1 hypothetical protein BOX15_Mlig031978g1 [Macrostomum lignano]
MSPKSWNPWKAFDISEKERQLIDKRRQMREFWAQEYVRKSTSPHRPNYRLVFDPAVQRAIAANATMENFFRPNRKSTLAFLGSILFPVCYALSYDYFYRQPFLKALANGEVPYRNRKGKELY